MKRFWKDAAVIGEDGGWGIALDGRQVRSPAGKPLVVPAEGLAQAIAGEWDAVGERVDPREMVLTGLANAALDRVEPNPGAFAAELANYAQGDLACYRTETPRELVRRQAERWDALLAWARRRFDVDFRTTCGVVHVPQPDATVERLAHAVGTLDSFRLAGLSPLVMIGGSLVAALAVLEGALSPETAWDSVTIDDQWQFEQWGADAEAEAALEDRRRTFFGAARFLELLND